MFLYSVTIEENGNHLEVNFILFKLISPTLYFYFDYAVSVQFQKSQPIVYLQLLHDFTVVTIFIHNINLVVAAINYCNHLQHPDKAAYILSSTDDEMTYRICKYIHVSYTGTRILLLHAIKRIRLHYASAQYLLVRSSRKLTCIAHGQLCLRIASVVGYKLEYYYTPNGSAIAIYVYIYISA